MAITRKGLDDTLIHCNPPVCLPPEDATTGYWHDVVRCSVRIEDVTCPTCIYYTMHPEARILEVMFRRSNGA
jgi:hypothetical protein